MTSVVPTPTSNPSSSGRRDPRRRSRARPGSSLLASGEPMLWLTGGALTLALTMILGLLALVLFNGGGTFWPVPITAVTLRDGSSVMGEVTREESYELTREFVKGTSGAIAEAAQLRLGDRDRAEARRRLFRIGNFELTQNHYQWVSDFELAPDGERLPEWSVLVERVEWGRFVGEWKRFVERHPRTPSPDEQDLELLTASLDGQLSLMSEEESQPLQASLAAMRELVARRQRENMRRFLAQATSEGTWLAIAGSGDAVPLDSVPEDMTIVELQQVWTDPESSWPKYEAAHDEVRRSYARRRDLERHEIGRVNARIEQARLGIRQAEIDSNTLVLSKVEELASLREQLSLQEQEWLASLERWKVLRRQPPEDLANLTPLLDAAPRLQQAARAELDSQQRETRERIETLEAEMEQMPAPVRAAVERLVAVQEAAATETVGIQSKIRLLNEEMNRFELALSTSQGTDASIPLSNIVRAYPANRLGPSDAWRIYGARWWEFLTDEPREANSEGGVFPAIFGTVAMTLIMSLAVVPFGVCAALYLREYARGGVIVSAVRISINNLAGVPSIVFGVFGLGFFCYVVGAVIDGGPRNAGITPWPPYAWYLGLLALAFIAVVAFILGIQSQVSSGNGRSHWLGRVALGLWLGATALLVILLFVNPYFGGIYSERLPNPTLGKGGLLWSSLTLALLTLPVVIVATEEALSAVPNSMREGSYACGAGKWQTIRRIVLPQAMPGIMTGMILAMARGAGEVAPLMLVGAVKLAPELPIDSTAPFIHPERSFMHLGFHIYDLGFQSQNSEAAKPMVFTTTLLLIALVATLNVAAVWLRGRLRRRFRTGQF